MALPNAPDGSDTMEAPGGQDPRVEGPPLRAVRVVDPVRAALFPEGTADLLEVIAAAARAWRDATDREAPSIERLAVPGTIRRIDADLASGYLAVVTEDDTWRAFVPRETLPTIVGLMLRRPIATVAEAFKAGPGSLTPQG